MHFILTPVGSSGDVYPFIGIGRRLRERGHEVTLGAAEPFRPVAEGAGLTFESMLSAEEYERITRHPDLWHPTRGLKLVFHLANSLMRDTYRRLERLYQPGRSVLVGHTLSIPTRIFEEKHGAPAATIHLAPNAFRSEFRSPALAPGIDISRLPAFVKGTLWKLIDQLLLDPKSLPELNKWRAELGLPPVERMMHEWIHSPRRVIGLFPDWFGDPQPDWPSRHLDTLRTLYGDAPAFREVWPKISELIAAAPAADLAAINRFLIEAAAGELGLSCRFLAASDMDVPGKADDRLVGLVAAVEPGAVYLSGEGGAKYQDADKFSGAGLSLSYAGFAHPTYAQGGAEFEAGLSVVDAVFHLGWAGAADLLNPA